MKNIWITSGVLLLCTSITAILPAQARTCNFSGLEDARLEKKSRSAQEFLDMMKQSMPGGSGGLPAYPGEEFRKQQAQKQPQPGIESVVVICDADTSLRGQIYYRDLESGFFRVEVMNARHENIAQIPAVVVAPTDGALEFRLGLNIQTPEPQYFRSQYLKITWLKKRDSRDGRSEWFAMSKAWKSPGNTQATRNLRLTPLKTAASLGTATATLPMPGQSTAAPSQATSRTTAVSNSDTASQTPRGADLNNYLSLFAGIRSDVVFQNPRSISPIQTGFIFRDKNPNADVYYYAPSAYYLRWEADKGFDFNVLYGASSNADQEGKVNMRAGLSSGVTNAEHQRMQRLLQAHLGTTTAPELRPLLPENPEVTLRGEGFSMDNISALAPSSIYDPIQMNWQTDVVNANDIITALSNNLGLNGKVTYRQTEGSLSPPAVVRLGEAENFGLLEPDWANWRSRDWVNRLPYPLQFQYLHVLLLNPNASGQKIPCIYSWKIEGPEVPSGGKARFDAAMFPQWLEKDARVLKTWFEYSVQPCPTCTEELLDGITTGTATSREKWIRVHSLGMLRQYNARLIKVSLRSRQVDPKGQKVREVSASIEQDSKDFNVGPFYAWMDKDVQYEMRLTLVTDEREVDSGWIPERDAELYLTKDVMRKAFGSSIKHPVKQE